MNPTLTELIEQITQIHQADFSGSLDFESTVVLKNEILVLLKYWRYVQTLGELDHLDVADLIAELSQKRKDPKAWVCEILSPNYTRVRNLKLLSLTGITLASASEQIVDTPCQLWDEQTKKLVTASPAEASDRLKQTWFAIKDIWIFSVLLVVIGLLLNLLVDQSQVIYQSLSAKVGLMGNLLSQAQDLGPMAAVGAIFFVAAYFSIQAIEEAARTAPALKMPATVRFVSHLLFGLLAAALQVFSVFGLLALLGPQDLGLSWHAGFIAFSFLVLLGLPTLWHAAGSLNFALRFGLSESLRAFFASAGYRPIPFYRKQPKKGRSLWPS